MKLENSNVYVIYACNLHKERDSMRIVGVAADSDSRAAVIAHQILSGNMDYRGFSERKGFELFRKDYRSGEFSSAHLDYGYVEMQAVVSVSEQTAEAEQQKALAWLKMSDTEYTGMKNGELLKDIPPERLRVILDRALNEVANDYRGAELYDYLRKTLEMNDDEIGQAGFNLSEFYAEPIYEVEYDNDLEDEV